MIAEGLALVTAFSWAASSIFAKKGLKFSDAASGVFLSTVINATLFWILTILFVPFAAVKTEVIFYFGISGFLSYFLATQLAFFSFEKVGVAKSRAILASQTLFSTLAAVVLLKETVTAPVGVGTILIVLGVAALSVEKQETGRWINKALLLPLLPAFLWGISAVPQKMGLEAINSPILGATVEASTSLLAFLLYLSLSRKKLSFKKDSLRNFSMSGLCASTAQISLLYAFNLGKVVIVGPLYQTSPLFALPLVHLFLGGTEKITRKIIVATILTVFGSTLIISF
jgi:drug/metabolite transporter (DMT)-like permease